jgi:uncharacterized membrane protein required for colicin V production
MTPLPEMQWWQDSVLLQWFEDVAATVQEYIPEDMDVSRPVADPVDNPSVPL